MKLPKVFLYAPVGVQSYLTQNILSNIDPKMELGLALTYDIFKYNFDDIHKFTTETRFLLVFPEGSRYQQKNGTHVVQTRTLNYKPDTQKIQSCGADMVVAFNEQYGFMKENVNRDSNFKEMELFQDYDCLVISKQHQLHNYKKSYILTNSLEIAIQAASQKIHAILNIRADIQTMLNNFDNEYLHFITSIPSSMADEEAIININFDNMQFQTVFTRNAMNKGSILKLDDTCPHECCQQNLGYLNHLVDCGELLGKIYCAMHVVGQLLKLVDSVKE